MSSTIVVPKGFSYVCAAALSSALLLIGQSIVVGKYRKAADIPYPQMYAEKAEADASKIALQYNCAQRAHQNTLENLPIVLIMTLVTGLRYPVYAASACGLWNFSRIFYTRGYVTGEPKLRNSFLSSVFGTTSLLGLLLSSLWTVGNFVLEDI